MSLTLQFNPTGTTCFLCGENDILNKYRHSQMVNYCLSFYYFSFYLLRFIFWLNWQKQAKKKKNLMNISSPELHTFLLVTIFWNIIYNWVPILFIQCIKTLDKSSSTQLCECINTERLSFCVSLSSVNVIYSFPPSHLIDWPHIFGSVLSLLTVTFNV